MNKYEGALDAVTCGYLDTTDLDPHLDAIKDALQKQIAQKSGNVQPAWIPVTERLPEDDLAEGSKVDEIRCYATTKDLANGGNHAAILYRCNDCGKWGWFSPYYDRINNPVTAWFPLPEPYKQEETP